jgi:DNA-binding transcriptional LysR family regulator
VEDIAGEQMIVRRHCEMLGDTSRFFTAHGVRPFMAARTVSDDRALSYVRSGLGITVMPRCFAGEGIAWVPLAGFNVTRRVGLVVNVDSDSRIRSSHVMASIMQALRTAYARTPLICSSAIRPEA